MTTKEETTRKTRMPLHYFATTQYTRQSNLKIRRIPRTQGEGTADRKSITLRVGEV